MKNTKKIERMRATLNHQESDRVPVGEFFWTGHMNRLAQKYGPSFDPYKEYDLDYIVIIPNLDPQIKPFEIISKKGKDIVLKTRFHTWLNTQVMYQLVKPQVPCNHL